MMRDDKVLNLRLKLSRKSFYFPRTLSNHLDTYNNMS